MEHETPSFDPAVFDIALHCIVRAAPNLSDQIRRHAARTIAERVSRLIRQRETSAVLTKINSLMVEP